MRASWPWHDKDSTFNTHLQSVRDSELVHESVVWGAGGTVPVEVSLKIHVLEPATPEMMQGGVRTLVFWQLKAHRLLKVWGKGEHQNQKNLCWVVLESLQKKVLTTALIGGTLGYEIVTSRRWSWQESTSASL